MQRLIDADMCIAKIKDLPVTYDSETVQRCIEVVSNAPTVSDAYSRDEANKILNELEYWMKKSEKYERTIIKLSVLLMEREQL